MAFPDETRHGGGTRLPGGARPRTFTGRKIDGRATHHDVIAQLTSAIALGTLRFGDRLPSERTLAEQRERWLSQQDETLTWRLRAEAAEACLNRRE